MNESVKKIEKQNQETDMVSLCPGRASSMANSTSNNSNAAGGAMGDWAIPYNQKLKYNQQFNQHDRQRKGFLAGW